MSEKLILKKRRARANGSMYYRVRVTAEAYDIVETIAEKANMTLNEVASRMIMFAAERTDITEDQK